MVVRDQQFCGSQVIKTRTQSNERNENTNDGDIKDPISDDLLPSSGLEFSP